MPASSPDHNMQSLSNKLLHFVCIWHHCAKKLTWSSILHVCFEPTEHAKKAFWMPFLRKHYFKTFVASVRTKISHKFIMDNGETHNDTFGKFNKVFSIIIKACHSGKTVILTWTLLVLQWTWLVWKTNTFWCEQFLEKCGKYEFCMVELCTKFPFKISHINSFVCMLFCFSNGNFQNWKNESNCTGSQFVKHEMIQKSGVLPRVVLCMVPLIWQKILSMVWPLDTEQFADLMQNF